MYLHGFYLSSSFTSLIKVAGMGTSATTEAIFSTTGLAYWEEMEESAAITALALFNLFLLLEMILPVISFMPESLIMSRITEPATSPRPLFGKRTTRELENLAESSWGMDIVFVSFSLIIFFLALRTALFMASAVSPALPRPKPTEPFLSPATNATEKENLRPPATTLVTRRIFKIFWSNSGFTRPKDDPLRLLFFFSLSFSINYY